MLSTILISWLVFGTKRNVECGISMILSSMTMIVLNFHFGHLMDFIYKQFQ